MKYTGNLPLSAKIKIAFLASIIMFAPFGFCQDDNNDEENEDPVMCQGDTLNASVRTFINYILVKNDPQDDEPIDDTDPGSDTDDLSANTEEDQLFEVLGDAVKQVTKARAFMQRSADILLKNNSNASLREWKTLDTINWQNTEDNLTSETYPESLDFIYDSDNCRSFEDIFSSVSSAKVKKLSKANLKHLKSSIESYKDLLKPILDVELITDSEYKSLSKKAKTAISVIAKASSKVKR